MYAVLNEPPQGRCLLTLRLGALSTFDQKGRIRIVVRRPSGGGEPPPPPPPPIASFELAVHKGDFSTHTFDLVFEPDPISPLLVNMGLKPGSGLDLVLFRWLTLAPAPPLDVHP
jgi:hypothetical protein